jgi:methylglyoxal synthase
MISKTIALVAHDHKKQAMVSWAKKNKEKLKNHTLYATGTTGKILEKALNIEKIKERSCRG